MTAASITPLCPIHQADDGLSWETAIPELFYQLIPDQGINWNIHHLSMSILVAGLLLLAPAIQAQDCSNWSLWALRGTYTFTGTAWQDLSEINPALPKGYAPVSIIGAFGENALP